MEKTLKSRASQLLLIAIGALLGAGMFAWARYECLLPAADFYCYREAAARILQKDGVDAALRYVDTTVSPRNGYAFAHFILHDVGEYAYGATGDLNEALSYLARYSGQNPIGRLGIEFDGFVHGVVSSHLLARGQPVQYDATTRQICADSVLQTGMLGDERSCHHALGHGLVHASANQAEPALEACEDAPTPIAREGCFYGAFMELSFLYLPDYHPGAPRPDSQGDSLKELCARIEGEAQRECMHFVGQSYLHVHPKDYQGAFEECTALGEFDETCAHRLGQVVVTNYARNEEEARTFCKKHAGELEEACITAALNALELGFGRETGWTF